MRPLVISNNRGRRGGCHGFLCYSYRLRRVFSQRLDYHDILGIIAPDFNVKTIGYPMAMLITIGVWLVVAPLAAAIAKKGKWG